jgi:hypothetical protein
VVRLSWPITAKAKRLRKSRNSKKTIVSKKIFIRREKSMKKTYLKPSMEVELFQAMDIVLASGAEFDVSDFFGGVVPQ